MRTTMDHDEIKEETVREVYEKALRQVEFVVNTLIPDEIPNNAALEQHIIYILNIERMFFMVAEMLHDIRKQMENRSTEDLH